MSQESSAVTIKGTSDGLVITLHEGPLDALVGEMIARIRARASFFVGGRVALRVGQRPLSVEQIETIGVALQGLGMSLWAVEGASPITRASARELGLEISLRGAPDDSNLAQWGLKSSPVSEPLGGVVLRGTVRSGQALEFPSHVTLIGDVNPGAQLVAAGDIIVWGRLRGTVHAGAIGDDGAVICALQLAPNQIRIGRYIARAPEADVLRGMFERRPQGADPSEYSGPRGGSVRERPLPGPEIARVQEGQIVVEAWDAEQRPGLRDGARVWPAQAVPSLSRERGQQSGGASRGIGQRTRQAVLGLSQKLKALSRAPRSTGSPNGESVGQRDS